MPDMIAQKGKCLTAQKHLPKSLKPLKSARTVGAMKFWFRGMIEMLTALESKILFTIQETPRLEKKTDHNQNRGWDWMKVSYSTLDVCFGGD